MSDKSKDAYARYNLELAWDEFEKSGEIVNYAECALQSADYFKDNHEKLVELLEYFYKQPVDLMQVWPAGHIAKQNEAISLLKELGHEI